LVQEQWTSGKREFVQVLGLPESFEMVLLHGAVRDALQMGPISFDAIKLLLLCRIERRPPWLDLDVYAFLSGTTVATTSVAAYMGLLAGDRV